MTSHESVKRGALNDACDEKRTRAVVCRPNDETREADVEMLLFFINRAVESSESPPCTKIARGMILENGGLFRPIKLCTN